jgi:hypothetical protein
MDGCGVWYYQPKSNLTGEFFDIDLLAKQISRA